MPLAFSCPATCTRRTSSNKKGKNRLESKKKKSPNSTPSESRRGASEPSRTSPTDPPPPTEHMTASWMETWGNLFHGGRAAPTKQALPGTNLMLMPPPIPEKKQSPSREPANPQQQRRSTHLQRLPKKLWRENPLWISIGRSKTTNPQEASYPLVLAGGVPTGAEGERKEAAQLTRRHRREQT